MCGDCLHWKRGQAQAHHGRRFAPCALIPDAMVKDSRDPRGVTEQAYRMSETYECRRFEKLEQI